MLDPAESTPSIPKPKMDPSSQEFLEAWGRLHKAGILNPQKLAVLPEERLPSLANLATNGINLHANDMLEWLIQEREAAIPQHQMLQAEHVEYHILHRYRLSREHEQEKQNQKLRSAQAEVQAVRSGRQKAPDW